MGHSQKKTAAVGPESTAYAAWANQGKPPSGASLLSMWWQSGMTYEQRVEYFGARGLLPSTRLVISGCALLLGGVAFAVLIGVPPRTPYSISVQLFGGIVGAAWAVRWAVGRVPSTRSALVFVFTSSLGIFLVATADADAMTGALALSSLSLTATFAALMLPPRHFLAHAAMSLAMILVFFPLLWSSYGGTTAVIKTFILISCAVGVPTSMQIALSLLSLDARVAYTDPMCGTLNRRGFYQLSGAHVSSRTAERGDDVEVSVVAIDVDNYKQINDRHGHAKGDDLLISVARILQNFATSHGALVARIGGDEFAIIAADVTRENCIQLGEDIRKGVERQGRLDGTGVTVSVGVSTMTATAEHGVGDHEIVQLLAEADEAMYRAKQSRNRVVAIDADMSGATSALS